MTHAEHQSRSGLGRQIATLVAIVGTLVTNLLSNFFPIGGMNIGEIANTLLDEVLIIPANYAFAIWGLIYLGLIAFGIYQLAPQRRQDAVLRQVDWLLIVACVMQIFWVLLFQLKLFGWSVLLMAGILIPLALIRLRLHQGREYVSRQERWFVFTPMSVYLGWISVASIVNVAAALYSAGWTGGGLSDQIWTVLMMGIAVAIAVILLFHLGDLAFPLVIVWALVAIAIRHGQIPLIWQTALALAIALLVVDAIAWRWLKIPHR